MSDNYILDPGDERATLAHTASECERCVAYHLDKIAELHRTQDYIRDRLALLDGERTTAAFRRALAAAVVKGMDCVDPEGDGAPGGRGDDGA